MLEPRGFKCTTVNRHLMWELSEFWLFWVLFFSKASSTNDTWIRWPCFVVKALKAIHSLRNNLIQCGITTHESSCVSVEAALESNTKEKGKGTKMSSHWISSLEWGGGGPNILKQQHHLLTKISTCKHPNHVSFLGSYGGWRLDTEQVNGVSFTKSNPATSRCEATASAQKKHDRPLWQSAINFSEEICTSQSLSALHQTHWLILHTFGYVFFSTHTHWGMQWCLTTTNNTTILHVAHCTNQHHLIV